MSKFKVTFTLKQHTPIIHFQANQSGATLRATELKPKFDKFLKEYVFDGTIPNKYKVKEDKDALDYKVKIITKNLKKQEIIKKIKKWNKKKQEEEIKTNFFPTFFATMGDEWEKSPKLFVYSDNVEVEIFTFHTYLLKTIEKFFPKFIFETNFGTRQSKGFGSFSVIKINNNPYNHRLEEYTSFIIDLNKINNKFFTGYKYVEKPDHYYLRNIKLFEVIDVFYKTLRSGINLNGKFYFKSLLYMFAKSQGVTWDKKYFKEQFLGDNNQKIREQREKHKNTEILNFSDVQKDTSFLVRDLLGLATIQEWLSYKKRLRHPKDGDRLGKESINKNSIERIKSPLTIKPIRIDNEKFQIFLLFEEIDEQVFNETITILLTHTERYEKGKKEIIDKKLDDLKFWQDFSLIKYFTYINKEIEIKKHIEKRYHQHPYYRVIENIYSQLKAKQ